MQFTTALDNSLVIPLYLASASALLLSLRIVIASHPVRALGKCFVRILCYSKEHEPALEAQSEQDERSISVRSLITDLGGPVIYGFKIARFSGCIAFLGLAIATLVKDQDVQDSSQLAVCTTAVSGRLPEQYITLSF